MSAGMIHDYPNTASGVNNTSYIDVDQEISSGIWQSQKMLGSVLKALMLSENIEQIHVADLQALATANGLKVLKQYYIDDAASGDRLLVVRAATVSTLFQQAYDLTTGVVGTYVLGTDKFTPIVAQYSLSTTAPTTSFDINAGYKVGYRVQRTTTGLVYICTDSTAGAAVWELDQSHVYSFRKTLNQANIYAAGYFDITECPAVAGYAWVCQNAQAQLSGSTTPYDGSSKVAIITDTASTLQFSDVDASLLSGSDSIGGLVSVITLNQTYTSDIYIPNKKLQVFLNEIRTAGDGDLTVFGTAVLIKTT